MEKTRYENRLRDSAQNLPQVVTCQFLMVYQRNLLSQASLNMQRRSLNQC